MIIRPACSISSEYFRKYVVSSGIGKGEVPVYWNIGASDFGLFNSAAKKIVFGHSSSIGFFHT